MRIRPATVDDLPRMAEMGTHFLAATPYGSMLAATSDTLLSCLRALAENERAVLFVADDEPRVIGMVAGWVFHHPFSGERIASELVWWVEPEARGAVGVRLLAEFEAWARDHGARAIQMIAPAGSAIGELYARRGYRPFETMYQAEV